MSPPQPYSHEDDNIVVFAGNATIEGLLGNDSIIAKFGNHIVYGDLSSVNMLEVHSDSKKIPIKTI